MTVGGADLATQAPFASAWVLRVEGEVLRVQEWPAAKTRPSSPAQIARGAYLPEIMIRERLWKDLLAVARRRRQRAEALAEHALSEYLQRLADEELLTESERAARQTRFPIRQTEAIVRKWRRKRKGA
jgi:hypothetical protein